MISIRFILLTLLWLYSITVFCQSPVIISQPDIIKVCSGDFVTLEVITDGIYGYQWYSALHDYQTDSYQLTELPGELSDSLIVNPVLVSKYPNTFYYFLRVAGESDTTWTNPIRIEVAYIERPIDDTIMTNKLPALIRLSPILVDPATLLYWSSGDTTGTYPYQLYNEFNYYGKHWLTTNFMGCSRVDTFHVVQAPAVLHISGDRQELQKWCADTVFIENDVQLHSGVVIYPGTTVQFQGDYLLSTSYIDAQGYGDDSIRILGKYNDERLLYAGKLYTTSIGYQEPCNQFKKCLISNLRNTDMRIVRNATFFHNDSISLRNTFNCIIGSNRKVFLHYSVAACTITENDSVFGIPGFPHRIEAWSDFTCSQCVLRNNHSGLIVPYIKQGMGYCYAYIFNNIFENHKTTALTLFTTDNRINQNVFRNNASSEGPSSVDLETANTLYDVFGVPLAVYFDFFNNTLFSNSGDVALELQLPSIRENDPNIMNNIFWNREGCDIRIDDPNSAATKINIFNNTFRGDSIKAMELPLCNHYKISGNLYGVYPGFSDTAKLHLWLDTQSPLINAGKDTSYFSSFNLPRYDFTGFPRIIDDTIDMGAYEYHLLEPLAFRYVTPDTLVCSADTVELIAVFQYEPENSWSNRVWLKDGEEIIKHQFTENGIRLTDAKKIKGVYIPGYTCYADTLWGDLIHVDYDIYPQFAADNKTSYEVCSGSPVTLKAYVRSLSNPLFSWNSVSKGLLQFESDTCHIGSIMENDTLFITAENLCGSASIGPVSIETLPLPQPFLGNDTSIVASDSVLLDAGAGYVAYLWSTGETNQQIYASTANGKILVWVTDAKYCTGKDSINIQLAVLSDQLSGEPLQFKLFPNPVSDRLYIVPDDSKSIPYEITLIDAGGQVVVRKKFNNSGVQELDLQGLTKGVYIVQIKTTSQTMAYRFVVL